MGVGGGDSGEPALVSSLWKESQGGGCTIQFDLVVGGDDVLGPRKWGVEHSILVGSGIVGCESEELQ